MAESIQGEKITELGFSVTIDGEKIKIGFLKKENGNARLFRKPDGQEIKGIFAIVQWFRRDEKLEKIAYNVEAATIEEARKEMAEWMPRLQYPEHRESSVLLDIVEHEETSLSPSVKTKTKHHGASE